MNKAGNIRRAEDLMPGQRLPGLIFGSPADERYLVKAVARPGNPKDAGMVRVSAVTESGNTEATALMRAQRRVVVLDDSR